MLVAVEDTESLTSMPDWLQLLELREGKVTDFSFLEQANMLRPLTDNRENQTDLEKLWEKITSISGVIADSVPCTALLRHYCDLEGFDGTKAHIVHDCEGGMLKVFSPKIPFVEKAFLFFFGKKVEVSFEYRSKPKR